MRGSAVFRTGVAPGGALAGPWVRNPLWAAARAVPSLDLRFADNKSLVDATTGSDLVNFTRASSGTYVGSDGLIKTAVTNLLLQSEDFLTTWTVYDGLSRTANQIVSPNGSTTADLLASNGVSIGYLEQPTASSNQFVSGTTYTYSVYLKKANTSTCLTLLFGTTFNSGGGNPVATWNLDTGVPSFSNGATGSMTPVGNGWYRCVITDTATQTHTQNQQWLRMASASGDVYAWGAQLEQSSTVGEYVKTTSTINSAPRFHHDPTTGESLGLLLEDQRTNLLVRSEEVDSVSWTVAAATVTANTGTSPAKTTTVDTVASTGTAVVSQAITKAASAITYSGSLFVKGTVTALSLTIDDGATVNRGRVVFNLSTGAISSTNNDGDFTGTSGTITSCPNSWYRITVTTTSNSTTSARLRFFWTGSGTSIDVWGAQLEAGDLPTSYIPTTSSTVTRAADVASISGSNFSSWYRQDEGAIFAEATTTMKYGGANVFPRIFNVSDGSNNNNVELYYRVLSPYTDAGYAIANGGVAQASFDTTSESNGSKLAIAVMANNFAFSTNGVLRSADASGVMPTLSQADIGRRPTGASAFSGTIRRLTYWPQRLSNETLQRITQ